MKRSRSILLPLLAALALPASVMGAKPSTKASFGYINGLFGSSRTDLYLDGKTVLRNAREGRPMKPKTLNAEGYTVQVTAAKVGFAYLDFPLSLTAGREYTLVPMGDLSTTAPVSYLLIDRPSLIVPKTASHVVFGVAMPDAPPVDLLIDGQIVATDIAVGLYTEAIPVIAGKHKVEMQVDGVSIYGPKSVNLKKGQTTSMVAIGTLGTGDKIPVNLVDVATKGL